MAYYTNVGPVSGPLRDQHGFIAIHVFHAGEIHTPVGMALAAGQGEEGRVLWRLTIHEAERPGLWIVVDRRSHPAHEQGREPRD